MRAIDTTMPTGRVTGPGPILRTRRPSAPGPEWSAAAGPPLLTLPTGPTNEGAGDMHPGIDQLQALAEAEAALSALGTFAVWCICVGVALALYNTINRRRDP